jgi:hypothetical protein
MFTLILLVAIFMIAILKKRQETWPEEAFHRTPNRLRFYAFARCRMQCLSINDNDIKDLMQTGVINLNRSSRTMHPCPVFALQGRVSNHYLRVLFEQCRNGTYVVNCYDLEKERTCDCAADYQPKQK